MDNIVEIILQAVDNASGIFSSVTGSAEEMGSTMETAASEASTGFDEIENSAQEATSPIQDIIDYCRNLDGSGPRDAASGMDELESATSTADTAVEDLGTDLDIINAGMLLQTAEQISSIAGNAEGMAQEMNTAAISVGQLATQTGIAEPQMVNLVNTISNATFPNDEAMMYIKSLDQMGVSAQNLGQSATDIDKINDAFGLGAQTTNSLAQELGVLGVDMNNVSSSFNALAYANANTVGGMQNYYSFLRKYDAQFKDLGFDVDQSSIIIAAATQKYGGGRAALSGLSDALKEADGDTRKLEEALGIQSGALDHASEITGEYSGQLQELADEEAEHKTWLDQLGAAWEDFSLKLSPILEPLGSAIGLIGEVGSFGMQVNGLLMLGNTLKGVVQGIRDFNLAKSIQNVLEGEGAIASIAGALGITTEAAAAEGATIAFGGLAVAEGAALWPILAIIAAIALLVVAVYEIGKAFGWWDDVGSMLEAIWSGIQRLWDAFINHPDVQAVLKAISDALAWIWSGLQQAGQAVLEFFGINTNGKFDVVRALIDGIGTAWYALTLPIRTVIGLLQWLWGAFSTGYNDTLLPFFDWLSGVFGPVWDGLGTVINSVLPYITALSDAFTQFMNGQLDLPGLVSTVASNLWMIYVNAVGQISSLIMNWITNIAGWAYSAGANFVGGISNWLSQLPGRVASYLVRTASNIGNNLNRWVNLAKNRALAFVTGIVTRLSQLPGRVYSILTGVVSRITSAIQGWINAAVNKARGIVTGVGQVLSGTVDAVRNALDGVKDAIVKPFQDAYNTAKGWWDKITSLGGAFGGEGAYGGEGVDTVTGQSFNIGTGEYMVMGDSSPIEINDTINLNVDLRNVPSSINTGQLIEALTDKNVLQSLTSNRDFQSLDAKVKQRIELKNIRARGR